MNTQTFKHSGRNVCTKIMSLAVIFAALSSEVKAVEPIASVNPKSTAAAAANPTEGGLTSSAQLYQTVRGTVVDAITQAPLVGATIMIEDTDKGTVADVNGNFIIHDVEIGRISIKVSFIGYTPRRLASLELSSAKEMVLNIEMSETTVKMDELTVKSSRINKENPTNSMAMLSARTFSVEESRRYAGGLDDPSRMAANFAGITTTGAQSNTIVIRGNAPSGILWRLEGTDITAPNHFNNIMNVPGGGMFTVFSSNMLSNSDFYTGAFPSEFGNAVSGVFDMKFRNGNNSKHEFAAQVGTQGIEFAAEGPFKKGYDGSYLFNIRLSTMGLVLSLLPDNMLPGMNLNYYDASFKVNLPTKNIGTFSLWGIGGKSILDQENEYEEDKMSDIIREDQLANMGMFAVGASHKKRISKSAFLSTTLAYTGDFEDIESTLYKTKAPDVPSTSFDGGYTNSKLSFSSMINQSISPRLSLRYGVRIEQLFNDMNNKAIDTLVTPNVMRTISLCEENTQLYQAHFQAKFTPSPRLNIVAGVNGTVFGMNGSTSIEPRLSIGYEISKNHVISFASGLHSKLEPLYLYFANVDGEYPNKDLPLTKSMHNVIGYNWHINQNMRLKVEPYFQYLFDVPTAQEGYLSSINLLTKDRLEAFDTKFVSSGVGRNIGIDVTLERFLNKGFYYMATASLFDSRYRDNSGDWHNTAFNNRYVINILGGKEFTFRKEDGRTNTLSINARVTCSATQPNMKIDQAASKAARSTIYDNSNPYTERFRMIEPISDISVVYRMNHEKCSSSIAIQLKNIVGGQYVGDEYNVETCEAEHLILKTILPFISYKIEF